MSSRIGTCPVLAAAAPVLAATSIPLFTASLRLSFPSSQGQWLSHIMPLVPPGLPATGSHAWSGAVEVGQSFHHRWQTPNVLHFPRSIQCEDHPT